jgi:GntR family transcriptional regulator/MocR family aminotransferase
VDEFPREIWRRLLAAHARRASSDTLGYGSPAGHGPLRAALSEYLGRARGVVSDPERIVVVNGTQQALDLIARVLLDPGAGAVVEEPHYPGATIPFEAVGARLLRVPVDAGGLDPAELPPAGQRPRLAYVTPCHQFPSGVIMPLERRLALLRWASRVGAWVVEDDYVSEFRYEGHPLEALQSLDRDERTIYVGSFSKTLFRAAREYLVLPRALVPRSSQPSGRRIGSPPRSTRRPWPSSSPAASSSAISAARAPGTRGAGGPSSRRCASASAAAWRSRARTPACTWWSG